MEQDRPGAPPTPWPRGPRRAAVRVTPRDGRLEVVFERGFTAEDVAVVKAIPGRRWFPDRLVWIVPDTERSWDALTEALGRRLVLTAPDRALDDGSLIHDDHPFDDDSELDDDRPLDAGPSRDAHRPRDDNHALGDDHPLDAGLSRDAYRPLGGDHPLDADVLLDDVRAATRTRAYSRRTEKAYVGWVRRFLSFHAGTGVQVEELDGSHARRFLEHLATDERLAPGSRNQAASALAFMFKAVQGRDELGDVPRAKGPKRAPLVLTHREVLRVLRELSGKHFLIAVLLYSAGLRLDECLRLRVKDVDFELRQILVRDGKGRKDRYVPLARRAADLLRAQIRRVAELHASDRTAGHGWAELPSAMHRKDPAAGHDLAWQYIFPATTLHDDPATGRKGRRPLHPTAVQREVKAAVRRSGIPKRATCHTFRHSFATETLRGGCDIRTLQHVMGHRDIRTTMIYLHVVEQTGFHVRSPLDRPDDPEDFGMGPTSGPWDAVEERWDLTPPRRASPPDPSAEG